MRHDGRVALPAELERQLHRSASTYIHTCVNNVRLYLVVGFVSALIESGGCWVLPLSTLVYGSPPTWGGAG